LVSRDKKQVDIALAAVDKALAAAPNNPELIYLKAQILRASQQHAASLELVNKALESQSQLPPILVKEMTAFRERALRSLQPS
jgi:tetratricopeptide (TPR) repeat protein